MRRNGEFEAEVDIRRWAVSGGDNTTQSGRPLKDAASNGQSSTRSRVHAVLAQMSACVYLDARAARQWSGRSWVLKKSVGETEFVRGCSCCCVVRKKSRRLVGGPGTVAGSRQLHLPNLRSVIDERA